MISPHGEGLLQQKTVECMDFYPCMLASAGRPIPSALRVHGSAVHIGRPGRQSDFLGRHEADDHPGQGLEKPPIYGVLMSAQS